LNLLSRTLADISSFKRDVLEFLSETFGYRYLFFHLFDEEACKFISPTTINIENCEKWINEYAEYYHQLDFFNPRNRQFPSHMHRNILTVTDIMSLEEYERTEIFRDLYRRTGYYYLANSYLKSGDRLLGSFSLLKPKDDANFTSDEIDALDRIIPYIANRLYDYLELDQIKLERQFYKNLIQEFPGPEARNTEPKRLPTEFYHLTNREAEIVELLAEGLRYKTIAERLLISFNTVRTHVENIREKVGANNRVTILNKLRKVPSQLTGGQ
jgi:DNA-binding CsgD family transcriptional regulator